jgi:hypothetical protein
MARAGRAHPAVRPLAAPLPSFHAGRTALLGLLARDTAARAPAELTGRAAHSLVLKL